MDPVLHARVAALARELHITRTGAYQMLLEQGLRLHESGLVLHATGGLERVGA